MIISGKNSVKEALGSDTTINRVLIENTKRDDFTKKIVDACKNRHIRFDFVDKKRLDKLSTHHQGIVAEITDYKYFELDDLIKNKKEEGHFIVILDGIEDPHNFGSIIRVCECAGVDGIVISKRGSCLVNDTVYKTSAGAVNLVKIAMVGSINDAIRKLKEENIFVYALEAGGESIYKTSFKGDIAFVLGSEGFGVKSLTKKLCDGVISLPLFGKINSLNVSTATSAVLYEAIRQREGK